MLYDRLGPDDLCMIVSDHGFTAIKQEISLNRWLEDSGYLKLSQEPGAPDRIHPETKAFALSPARIYINSDERFFGGSVKSEHERIEIRELIAGELGQLAFDTDSGSVPVIREVCRREEIYSGPLTDHAPDLVALANYGFDLKGTFGGESIFQNPGAFSGMHTRDDALLYVNRKHLEHDRPHIRDVAPTVLQYLGVEIPPVMDGSVLLARE